MFFVLRYFTLFTLAVFLLFNNVLGGDGIKPSGGMENWLPPYVYVPNSQYNTLSGPTGDWLQRAKPYYNQITGEIAGYMIPVDDPNLNLPNQQHNANAASSSSGPSTGELKPIALPYYDNITGHLIGYMVPIYGSNTDGVPASTGQFRPQKRPADAEKFEDSIEKAKRTCVGNIMYAFQQLKVPKCQIQFAFAYMNVNSTVVYSPAQGYYHLLAKYINTDTILGPNEYCSTLQDIHQQLECKNDLKIFTSSKSQAVGYAYYHYKMSELTSQYQIDYMVYISNNFSLYPNIPDPKTYCSYMHDYTGNTSWW